MKEEKNYENILVTDCAVMEQARLLINKYRLDGLRTLDSIQLATGIMLIKQVELFFTADKLLEGLFEREGLKTKL
jgi:hypothetical protein